MMSIGDQVVFRLFFFQGFEDWDGIDERGAPKEINHIIKLCCSSEVSAEWQPENGSRRL